MSSSLQNHFIGARSYEEKDKDIFFGREAEANELFQLVTINTFTLLYGKSGLGKTSVLQAGLFPKLRDSGYVPIYIRLNYRDKEKDFVKKIENIIIEAFKVNKIENCEIPSKQTLWEYLHIKAVKKNNQKGIVSVLIFDQFEEIFTLGTEDKSSELRNNTKRLVNFLSDLIENSPPEALDENTRLDLQYKYGSQTSPVKIIFSFREEYLGDFYSLSKNIPSIAYSNLQYKLMPLTFKKGYEIIKKASAGLFDAAAINETLVIISESSSKDEAEKRDIDSFLLSIFCESQIENFSGQANTKITSEEIQKVDVQNLVYKKYEDVIKELDLNADEKKFIEERMLSPEGFRLPVYLDGASKFSTNIRIDKLENLVDKKILKRYLIDGRHVIEIIHDKYALAVKTDRDFRYQDEQRAQQLLKDKEDARVQKLEDDRKIAKQQAKLAEKEKKLLEAENKLQKRKQKILIIYSVIGIVAIVLVMYVLFYLFVNSSAEAISGFTNNEEKSVLENTSQNKGPYKALLRADTFYKKVNDKILSKTWLVHSDKLSRLKSSLDTLLVSYYNRRPFYEVRDASNNIFQFTNFSICNPRPGVVCLNKNDSFFNINYVNSKNNSSVKLLKPVDSVYINVSNIIAAKNVSGSLTQSSFGSAGINPYAALMVSTVSYVVLFKDSNLYVFSNTDTLNQVASWKIVLSSHQFVSPSFVSVSADERFIILCYQIVTNLKNKSIANKYVIIPIIKNATLKLNNSFPTLSTAEHLLTVGFNKNQNIIAYTYFQDDELNSFVQLSNGFWNSFFPPQSKFELKKYVFINNSWKLQPGGGFSATVTHNENVGVSNAIGDESHLVQSLDKRYLFYREDTSKKWTVFDLKYPENDKKTEIIYNKYKPLGIYNTDSGNIALMENFEIFSLKDMKYDSVSGQNFSNAVQLKNIKLINVALTNKAGWLTVNTLSDKSIPYFGLFNLLHGKLYLFPSLNTASSIYINENQTAVALPINQASNQTTSIFYWYYSLPLLNNSKKIDNWIANTINN